MANRTDPTGLEKISSRDNKRIKAALRVRLGKDKSQLFLEGARLTADAITSSCQLYQVFLSSSFTSDTGNRPFIHGLASVSSHCFEVSDNVFAAISDTKSSQGVIALAKRPVFRFDDIRRRIESVATMPLVLFLNEINNPANLGAIVRSSEAAGASGVILSPGSANPFSPAAIRGSMGSILRLPVLEGIEFKDAAAFAREAGLRVVATSPIGGMDLYDLDWKLPSLLVLGSEAHGLPEEIVTDSDIRVRIQMNSTVESLNLAVATSVILFEARRQIERT